MALDPRTPVLVGVGQTLQRTDDVAAAAEPLDLLERAARLAAEDAGTPDLLRRLDVVRVVMLLSWRYRDPARLLARRVGADARSGYTAPGGNTPQMLVNRTATQIQAGELDAALLAGAECWRTRMRAQRAGMHLDWQKMPDDAEPDERFGEDTPMVSPLEQARGLVMPVQLYPMFENALRAAAGTSIEDHQVRISELWSRFSEVAATNPHAWLREARTPEEIRTPSAANRMIGFPYPKLMNSNNDVDMGAALLLVSVERARALGIPEDRWVFPHAGTDAHDTLFVSTRRDLRSSPAIRVAGRRLLELAGVGVDDLAHVDVYSCFPSAVQVAATELGLGLDRPLTVTGGLSFAGGPWNDYVSHAIASMADRLRSEPGTLGLVTANGGYLTKHALGVYGTEPPTGGFRHDAPQAEVERAPQREAAAEHDGPVRIESYTVMHDREGAPETFFAACLLPDGRRAWGVSRDVGLAKAATVEDDLVGRSAHLAPDGTVALV